MGSKHTGCTETGKDKDNNSKEMKLVEPLSVNNSSVVESEEQSDNIEDINIVMVGITDKDSDSEESESFGYMPLDEESGDSLGIDVNANTEIENTEEMSVILIEK